MPRKRNVPKCCKCDNNVIIKYHNGQLKNYLKTCEEHKNFHHIPGADHHNAKKNGRRYTKDGYVQVLIPNRIQANKKGSNYILEHRLVMEIFLARKLENNEVVHHLNGIRDDNRTENLVVLGPEEEHENRTYIKALQKQIRELELKILKLTTNNNCVINN